MDVMLSCTRKASGHIGTQFARVRRLHSVKLAGCWTREHCLLRSSSFSVSRAYGARYTPIRHYSAVDSTRENQDKMDEGVNSPADCSGSEGHAPSKADGKRPAIKDFVDTCKEVEEHIVFDRHKYSKHVKANLLSLGASKIADVFGALDCLNLSKVKSRDAPSMSIEEFLTAISDLLCVFYVSTTAGIGVSTEHLLNYLETLHSALLDLLDEKTKADSGSDSSLKISCHSFGYTEYGRTNFVEALSKSVALLLLSACEAALVSNVSKYADALLHESIRETFLELSAGSCINAVAFIHAMSMDKSEGALDASLETLCDVVDALSTKETTMGLPDLFYCKLWLTCVSAHHPSLTDRLSPAARSFVNNVVMLEHIGETIGTIDESHAPPCTHLRKENLPVELDSVTLEPFVFSVLSYSKMELYLADITDNYFDGPTRSSKREWFNWRRMVAELNGWKVVEVQL